MLFLVLTASGAQASNQCPDQRE